MKVFKNRKMLLLLFVVFAALITFIGISYSAILDNDVEVKLDTNLTYYLDVNYDGVDRYGIQSSNSATAEINSGVITITDKIPDGLTFIGFVTTDDGSIGAVKRSDGSTCVGKVIDDTNEASTNEGTWNNDNTEYTYHGLHYNANNRTVTFKVKNLKAGCKLTVGIITKTPASIDDPLTQEVETRRDFYNFATIKEDSLTIDSNTVHVFMGDENLPMYYVDYNYVGDNVPYDAPLAPESKAYVAGAKVTVAPPVDYEGYTFSGWTSTDVTITNGSFTMPNNHVILQGSFTSIDKNDVIYEIDGVVPSGYIKPSTKDYYPESNVKVDSLSDGDVFNGYRFNGWDTSDVLIDDNNHFIMPDQNVTLRGAFTEVKYSVTYVFNNGSLPPNASSLLPEPRTYSPGETVVLADVIDPDGYHFLGWYHEDNFTMPEENIVIYGEWMVRTGTFEPTITKELVGEKVLYRPGETVTFKTTVTNTASFPIHDVMVKENVDNARFIEGEGYNLETNHIASIDNLNAGASIDLYSTYVVLDTDADTVTNEVILIGALADNHYVLKDKEYKATATFSVQSNLVVHHYLEDTTTKVYEDEISEIVYGTGYTTSYKSSDALFDEYKNDYEYNNNHTGDPINGTVNKSSIEVTYYYHLKPSMLTIHYYVDGTSDSLCADIHTNKLYRDSYEAHTCNEISNNYRFKKVISSDNNSVINNTDVTGIVKQDNIVITYYYELKPSRVTTHHKDVNSNNNLVDDVVQDLFYGNEYTSSISSNVPQNYEFVSRTDNYTGIISQDNIEITYYYQQKDSNLSASIIKTGTDSLTSRNDKVTYNIKYNATVGEYVGDGTITIIDYLPYKIDTSNSNLDGGVYNDTDKTITWNVTWSGINSYSNNSSKEINKQIIIKYIDYPPTGVIINRVSGKIVLSNNNRTIEGTISTNINIPGKIIVHHYLAGTEESLRDDVVGTGLVNETYITKALELEGYKVVKIPDKETLSYKEEDQEVTYEYERLKYDIVTEVIGGVGNITGDETIYYGEDSTKDKIVITPNEGYEITRIIVNDKDIQITNKDKMILDNFKSVKENIKVQVEFGEKVAPTPITGKTKSLYIIVISLILLAITVFIVYKKETKDNRN